MNKRKWLYIVVIFIIIVPLLFFYQAFNGNPLSKLASTVTLKNYLEKEYPEKEFRVEEGFYNFKISGYQFNVVQIGTEEEYEFEVTGTFKPTVWTDGIYYANLDEPLIEKFGEQASEEISNLIIKDIPELLKVTVQLEVLKGSYDDSTTWDKNLKIEKPMYIHITTDAKGKTKEDILKSMNKIQKLLNMNGYTYESATINANVIEKDFKEETGYVKFHGSWEPEDKIKLNAIQLEE